MIKVSIIVPVYNVEAYLDKCLDSLVNQTLQEIQIIIVNDGSTDNSHKIIEKYKEQFGNKIIYVNKENGGLSDARNAGLKIAEGEYIGYVDGDDYADITMFEKMYARAKYDDADMVECDYYRVYNDKLKPKIGKTYQIEDKMNQTWRNVWNKIIRQKIITENKILYPVGLQYEDVEYFYKIIPYVKKIVFVKEPLYYYVQRIGSICHIYDERATDIFIILNNILTYYHENGLYEKYESQLEYLYARTILGSSFINISRIHDRKMKKKLLHDNLRELMSKFPNWRRNNFLCNSNSMLDIFVKSQNCFTYRIYSLLFKYIKYH